MQAGEKSEASGVQPNLRKADPPEFRYSSGIFTDGEVADAQAASSSSSTNPEYLSWKATYPCLLTSFEQFVAQARGKKLCIFLDYDGTLSPIVKDPDLAYMPEQTREAVAKLAQHLPTAIITGRCLEKVIGFVKLDELFYAGSHGLDISGPQRGPCARRGLQPYQPAAQFIQVMNDVHDRLQQAIAAIPGAAVEHNKFAVSVHFRCCDPQDWDRVAAAVTAVVGQFGSDIHITRGRKVLEVRPNLQWDKGKAVLYLLEELGLGEAPDALPVYLGDDTTDEDAFKALRGRGLGVLVSSKVKPTAAAYTLKDPHEVLRFLQMMADWVVSEAARGELRTVQDEPVPPPHDHHSRDIPVSCTT